MKFKPYKCQHKFVADEHLFESVTNDTLAPTWSEENNLNILALTLIGMRTIKKTRLRLLIAMVEAWNFQKKHYC